LNKLNDQVSRSHLSRSLVGINEGDELGKWQWESRTDSGASNGGSGDGLDTFEERVEQFIIVLFFSPLEFEYFAQATEKRAIAAFPKEFLGPAVTQRLDFR
jgi:hypothetical protein